MSPLNGSFSIASRAFSTRRWSLSGNFASDFFAGLVTSSVQFIVELVKGDEVSALVGGATFADGGSFGFCRRVERVAAFIELCGAVNGDRALAYGEFDQIAWL